MLFICAGLFVIGRVAGLLFGGNNWSFMHWAVQPVWYSVAWTVLFFLALVMVTKMSSTMAEKLSTGTGIYVAGGLLMAGMIALHFDSFFYGAGNLRIAQVAQADKVIIRWFEMGSVGCAALLVTAINAVATLKATVAGQLAWQIYGYMMTTITLFGAIALARLLSERPSERISIALLLFFGPHSLILFGYTGPEPVIPAAVLWTGWWMMKALGGKSKIPLVGLWLTVVAGVIFHVACLILIPAAIFTTVATFGSQKKIANSIIAGLAVHVVGVAGIFWYASTNLEFARNILFINGISPDSDYGLFSIRHLSDHVQRLLLVTPMAIAGLFLLVTRWRSWFPDTRIIAALFLTVGGGMTSFITSPVNSVVADLPRMAALLAPASLLLVLLIMKLRKGSEATSPLSFAAVIAIFVPLAVLPVYRSTLFTSFHIEPYYQQHDSFYYRGALSLRDAFYGLGNYDKANEWEQILPIESPQHINIQGCRGLVSREEFGDAVRSLSLMKVRYPYWVEARAYLASIQVSLSHPDLAKPDIDTCLMMDPFDKSSLTNQYIYYRETGDFARAIELNEEALEWYPTDTTMRLDQMALYYRRGDLVTSERLANQMLSNDSSMAFPWLIKGIAEDAKHNVTTAMKHYQRFIDGAPNDLDVPRARKRINDLTLQSRGEQPAK